MFKYLTFFLTFVVIQQFVSSRLLRSYDDVNDDEYKTDNDHFEDIKEDLPDNLDKTIDDLVSETDTDNFETDDGDLQEISQDQINEIIHHLVAQAETDNLETDDDHLGEINEDLPYAFEDADTDDFETDDDDFQEASQDQMDEIIHRLLAQAETDDDNLEDIQDTFSRDDFEDELSRFHEMIITGLSNITKTLRDVTDTYISSVVALKSNASQGIFETNKKNGESYEAIKQKAEEAGIDVELCETFFDHEDAEISLASLGTCIANKVDSGLESIRNVQDDLVNYLLGAGYKVDKEITECGKTDYFCLNDIQTAVKKAVMVIPGQIEGQLIVAQGMVAPAVAEVQVCVDTFSSFDNSSDLGLNKGFENCINREIEAQQ